MGRRKTYTTLFGYDVVECFQDGVENYSVVTWNVHITNRVSFNDMTHIFIKHQVHSIITGVLAEALFHRRAVLGCNRPLSISETIRVDQSPNTP